MTLPFKNLIRYSLAFLILILSCQSKQDKIELNETFETEKMDSTSNPMEEEIKVAVENLLFAAGNYNLEDLDAMISDKAMLGISSLKDGIWSNSEIAIDDFYTSVKKNERSPYCEIPTDYDIMITEDRLALVRADCILYRHGVPQTREINHFMLMKEDEKWKFLNISWTKYEIPEEKKEFNLDIFARSYAQAWCSKRANYVASYYAPDGSLVVNEGKPAVGTKAITNVAQGFMDAFPDIVVSMDSLITKSDKTFFYWTLTGTNNGPGGTGNKVKISGFEEWTLNKHGLVRESKGHYDAKEYKRQLEFGIDN